MPVYQCAVQPDVIPVEIRPALAEAITRLHCDATGAPASFVNVLFNDVPVGSRFTAGRPAPTSVIGGTIRAGRTLEVKQKLITGISAEWSRISGQDERFVVVGVTEVESAAVVEAGLLMPAPGEEAEWLETNRERLAELIA